VSDSNLYIIIKKSRLTVTPFWNGGILLPGIMASCWNNSQTAKSNFILSKAQPLPRQAIDPRGGDVKGSVGGALLGRPSY
jgi:hypothetical protein